MAKIIGQTQGINPTFSPDGRLFAYITTDCLWVHNLMEQRMEAVIDGNGTTLAFSPDGKTLALGTKEGTIRLWDVATKREVATLHREKPGFNVPHGWTYPTAVRSLAFSQGGKTLAAGIDNFATLWDVASKRGITTLEGHSSDVRSIAFAADGQTLATGGETIKLWDMTTHKGSTLRGPAVWVKSIAFSPDGKTLASACVDGPVRLSDWKPKPNSLRLWDVATQREIATLVGHSGDVNGVAFSPDGETLATCMGNTIKLWDLATCREIATLEGHLGSVKCVAFSPDGKVLASSSFEGTIKLWLIKDNA